MALIIRMRQQGAKGRHTFRVVVTDSRNPRDGKYLEMLGWYNPNVADENYSVKIPRIQHWLEKGAELSERVKNLLGRSAPEVIKELTQKDVAKRAKRKEKRSKK